MCVIVVKCKGSDFAPLDVIEKCIQRNPDGFSMAWNQQGRLNVYKTMNPTEAMAKYKTLSESLDPKESALVFHARLATHGTKKVENCHGYIHGDIAFFHNGVLRIKNRDDMTDSETYFRDFFVPAMDNIGFEFAMKMSRAVIGDTNNKFAVVDKDGNVSLTSGCQQYQKVQFDGYKGKIYFSNLLWRPVSSFTSCLGFDPYKSEKKPSQKTSSSTNNGILPLFGHDGRKRVAPKEPLAIHKDKNSASGLTFEEQYQHIFG